MAGSLGVLMIRISSIWARRSAILAIAAATAINLALAIETPRDLITNTYALISSIAISILTLSGLRDSCRGFFRALLYCGGGRISRISAMIYISMIASLPSYPISAVLYAPYIAIATFILSTLYISRISRYFG